MLQNIRPDYLFSYWVFFWYILYIVGLVHQNPKLAIILALLENVFMLVSMAYLRIKPKNIFYFFLIVVLIKVIPLWTLRNTQIQSKDLYITLGLVLMYIGWIIWDEKTNELVLSYKQILNNSIQTPGMLLLDKLFH
jgi:hypothetical protein